ncbi:MAG: hypothetical protein A2X56_08595 [Nitrospirae bacterium GWC2_57_13]|nr:MAG: hypothetical protein A2X56_08595 [Nitrospirae bacterium GWC2_57_13]OGW42838.1 MAG: hypothetical protein A2X57_01715 [Nitrospirae bacterium GWD2_57_8]
MASPFYLMAVSLNTYLARLTSLGTQPMYLVGGSVRDLLKGTVPLLEKGTVPLHDIDLVMPSGSELIAQMFADAINGSFFVLDEDRKMTRVVKHEAGRLIQFDFADFIGPDLEADLGRRDFTVNAMALDLRAFVTSGSLDSVIDLFNGLDDLGRKLIKAVRPEVLDDDPVRLLRAVRFAASLGFLIEEGTAAEIRKRAALITRPSPERIRDELFQILSLPRADRHLMLMDSLGLLAPLFPELDPLRGFMPGTYLKEDVLAHTFKTVGHVDSVLDDLAGITPEHVQTILEHCEEPLEQFVPRKAALRFACLLHDIAKPDTFTDKDGHVRFHGHDNLGAGKAQEICRRFRLSRDTEAAVASVIKYHMRLFSLTTPQGPSRNALYRYCRDLKANLPESLILAQADARATAEAMPKEKFTDTGRPMAMVFEYYYGKFLKTEAQPLVSGQDLIELGFEPGPRFREVLEAVKERQAAGEITTRDEALEYLKTLS